LQIRICQRTIGGLFDFDFGEGAMDTAKEQQVAQDADFREHRMFSRPKRQIQEGDLKYSLPSTKHLVEKIREKFPDAELRLDYRGRDANYLTLSRPDRHDRTVRISNQGADMWGKIPELDIKRFNISNEAYEEIPSFVPKEGTPQSGLRMGQMSRDSFDDRVDSVLKYFEKQYGPPKSYD
jgi:hypothetical protein